MNIHFGMKRNPRNENDQPRTADARKKQTKTAKFLLKKLTNSDKTDRNDGTTKM